MAQIPCCCGSGEGMKRLGKYILCLLAAFALLIPIGMSSSYVDAATKKPTFNKTKLTFNGLEKTYELEVKNPPKNSKLTWTSTNKKVATVNSLGTVTPVNKGNTKITCTITYPDKSKVDLICNVTVKIPATDVKISNAQLVDNAHHMLVGEKFDFNRKLTPKNSTYKSYWVIKGTDYATVDSQGVVTALKKGYCTLEVRSGESKKKAMASDNTITDNIIIIIEEPVAKVVKSERVDSKTVAFEFSDAMNKDSFITTTGELNTKNVYVDRKTTPPKNDLAADPGKLTASLSADGKRLTITAANEWEGLYGFHMESSIVTVSGLQFKGYNDELDLGDKLIPAITHYKVDDTGMVGLVIFNKPVDITELQVNVDTSIQKLEQYTIDVLSNKSNYALSEDKMTLRVNMASISSADYNKAFIVYLSGIKDLKGITTEPYRNEIKLYTDTSSKPNAVLKKVVRTSYNTVSAYFDRAITYPGTMILNNTYLYGTVNTKDNTIVDWQLDYNLQQYLGVCNGSIYGWMSYNSTTSGENTNISVNMGVGAQPPQIIDTQLVTTQNNGQIVNSIILTYDKDITLLNENSAFNASYSDAKSNIYATYIPYAGKAEGNKVTLILSQQNNLLPGSYIVKIPPHFVVDAYQVYNKEETIVITPTSAAVNRLSAPKEIVQQTSNPSEFVVYFNQKLDTSTAQDVNNYFFDGAHPTTAYLQTNLDSGSAVVVTLASGTLKFNGKSQIRIQNIKGYGDTYSTMDTYTVIKDVKENQPPRLESAVLVGSTIELTFDEILAGKPVFNVYSYNSLIATNASIPATTEGKKIIINLAQGVSSSNLYVKAGTGCEIKDINGNKYVVPGALSVRVN